jgi:hypothetical protein
MNTLDDAIRNYDMDAAARRLEADRTPCVADPVPESVNVAGLDEIGRLCVFVSDADPELSAVDRALLYEAAPKLLATCEELLLHLDAICDEGQLVDGEFCLAVVERGCAAIAKAKP